MSDPPLYEEYQVLKRLKLRGHELEGLLNVGIIAPVACGAGGQPLYSAEAIDALATREQEIRLVHVLWWDFDLNAPKYLQGQPWARAVDLPFYPFDDEEQQAWARRYYKLRKACAPFPYPYPERLARYRCRMEERATKAFEKAHGIKRKREPRKSRRIGFSVRYKRVAISRAKLRDLVWSKTMIRAAADLEISEFTLRKICKRYLIPLPTRGHFNHKDPRDRPPKPALRS
jgi:hypothetical protein